VSRKSNRSGADRTNPKNKEGRAGTLREKKKNPTPGAVGEKQRKGRRGKMPRFRTSQKIGQNKKDVYKTANTGSPGETSPPGGQTKIGQ